MHNQMLNTAKSAGINIIGKHKAAKLLALCMAFGEEPFVFSDKLNADVMAAADMCGIGPMRTPDGESVILLNCYYQDLQKGANWVDEINEEYGTDFKNKMETDGREKLSWQSTHT